MQKDSIQSKSRAIYQDSPEYRVLQSRSQRRLALLTDTDKTPEFTRLASLYLLPPFIWGTQNPTPPIQHIPNIGIAVVSRSN